MYKIFNLILFIVFIFNLRQTKCKPFFVTEYSNNSTTNIVKLKDILSNKFEFKGFNASWASGTELFFKNAQGDLLLHDIIKKKSEIILENNILKTWNAESLNLSPEKTKILIRYETSKVFRHSFDAKFKYYDLNSKKTFAIANGERIQFCSWVSNSDMLIYIYKNNIYLKDNSGLEKQLTINGVPGIIYNGIADWVYEEEVLRSERAFWLSPNGQNLAYAHFNDTQVNTVDITVYFDNENNALQYPNIQKIKYPKSGTQNPLVNLNIINLTNVGKKQINIPVPIEIVSNEYILKQVNWINSERILVTWLNRRQNRVSLQDCDMNGNCKQVYKHEEPNGWIELNVAKCSHEENSCIVINWIGDYMQLWNLDLATGRNKMSSLGKIWVFDVLGVTNNFNNIFYTATKEDDPTQTHVYVNKNCLSCIMRDVDGTVCKYASGTLSKDLSHYSITCLGPTPKYTKIFRSKDHQEINMWENNAKKREEIRKYQQPQIKFMQVPVNGGHMAMVKLLLPPNISLKSCNNNTIYNKYALIVSVYGGPNSVRVSNKFAIDWETYLVTFHNFIYAIIDGRGSGAKGKKMLFEINNSFGTVEITDQLEVTKYLQKKFSFIDEKRTGIWGWSYGGYATAMVLAKDYDNIFQCGISVAPVTSWIFYDTIYTERYMGLPTKADNLLGYKEADVTAHLDNFKNHDYLLIHGNADDNVHYQNSMILSKALQNSSILFKEMSYPDEDHSLANVRNHFYHTMEQFWTNCFS